MTLTTLALITSSMAFDANQPMQVDALQNTGGVIIINPKEKPKKVESYLMNTGGVIIINPKKPKEKEK